MTPADLYHYTCPNAARAIGPHGLLLPNPHPAIPGLPPLVWLTDLDTPGPALGMSPTHPHTGCHRTAVRYRVLDPSACIPWLEAVFPLRVTAAEQLGLALGGAEPSRWWVSLHPVPAART